MRTSKNPANEEQKQYYHIYKQQIMIEGRSADYATFCLDFRAMRDKKTEIKQEFGTLKAPKDNYIVVFGIPGFIVKESTTKECYEELYIL